MSSGLNKRSGSKFQRISPEEGQGVQRPKLHEYHNKDEDKSPNTVNSVNSYNTSS